MGAREDSRTVKVAEPITLDDLRWLVEQCDGADGKSRVEIVGRIEYDQRDYTPSEIVVRAVPVRPISLPTMDERAARR